MNIDNNKDEKYKLVYTITNSLTQHIDEVTNNKVSMVNNYIYSYDFDYNFYKELYLNSNDISSGNDEQIKFDFIKNGYFNFRYGCIKEYCDYNYISYSESKNLKISDIKKKINKKQKILVIKNYWNINFKTCIIIHAFDITIFKEIIKRINNTILLTFCNLIIVSPTTDIINYIKDELYDINLTLLYIKNKGMDTYGKLIAFKYIYDNKLTFEWFLYLHTKTNINWFNDLINPLLNKKVIYNIQKNEINKDVYMIGSDECKTILKTSNIKNNALNLILNKGGYKVKINNIYKKDIEEDRDSDSDRDDINNKNIGSKDIDINDINSKNNIYAYWKLNIDLKYYLKTYKEVHEHYNLNHKNEVRIYLDDYINNHDHLYYIAGTMYWSRINLIYHYKNMLNFLLSTMNISKRIIYSSYDISTIHISELLDGILIQLNNKKILFLNNINNALPENFNYIFYKLNNPDLPYTNKNDLIEHYLKHGIHENRYISFNSCIYNNIYKSIDFSIFKNLGYTSPNYKYINYKCNNFNYYNVDICCINNVYINLNYLIETNMNKHINKGTDIKYILIITFGIGGGTDAFLNKLINYYIYKKCTNIIILKYINDEYVISYNNLIINKTFNFDTITNFINQININLIFVNTFYTFPDNFKNFIYKLRIKKYTITHDYYNFMELPNPVYLHLKYKELYKNEINNFDVILTQNLYNIDVMNYICPINKEIHLIDFPDYYSNKDNENYGKIDENYNRVKILIIGIIDYKKGSLLINKLIDKIGKDKMNKDKKYDFYIAGKHYNKKISQQEYKTIHEFNNILSLFKPDVILFTSLCPETYSYTLTLAMLTELPIIYYDIGDCVVSKRLEEYKFGSYKLNDINNFKSIVNTILENTSKKYKLINNSISISKYWDNLFINDNKSDGCKGNGCIGDGCIGDCCKSMGCRNYYENVILITSKIYVSNNKFSYIEKRSIYTKDERFMQTINTINSIKKMIPNSFIVLIDNSTFTSNEKEILINSASIFINHNDKILDYHTNNNEIKAIAELCQIKYALNVINNNNIHFNNFFKITGRYIINSNFVYETYTQTYKDDNIFKRNKSLKDRLYYYTCFYKISSNNFNDYVNKIFELYNQLVLNSYENIYNIIDLEFLLPSILQFKEINVLGIKQFISCFNEISNI